MSSTVNLVLCWHMHQPYYRDGLVGDYQLPWVYLHATKDYDDMVAHLERHPGMQAVVNFAPVLLEQIDHYAQQIGHCLQHQTPMPDPLLNWLAGITPIPSDRKGRKQLLLSCRRAHAPRMIEPYPPFQALFQLFGEIEKHGLKRREKICLDYLDEQYFYDLLTWYHLAWMSYARKQTPLIKQLIAKGKGFTPEERRALLEIIHDCLSGLIPRYRALAERGQVELSMTPYGHPIVPLLNNLENMCPAQPQDPLPVHPHYPGGKQRSRWHLQRGQRVFEHYFGQPASGTWLSEGGISDDALEMIDDLGFSWTASGEAVWRHSLNGEPGRDHDGDARQALFSPYRQGSNRPNIYFRDDGLSDLIGFEYSQWHADDAVANFIHHLENIARSLGEGADRHVVSVILDGENAWEYYPDNGHHFIDELYRQLSEHEQIRTTTFNAVTDELSPSHLTSLVPGSWVYGTFSTWIGSRDKNRAWDLLIDAKHAYDKRCPTLKPDQQALATQLLAVCEGSDWFWWFGEGNAAESVKDFDRLYRTQLKKLYQLLELTPPASLDVAISVGGGHSENAGTMKRNQ